MANNNNNNNKTGRLCKTYRIAKSLLSLLITSAPPLVTQNKPILQHSSAVFWRLRGGVRLCHASSGCPRYVQYYFIVIAPGHGPVLFGGGADSTWLLQQILEDSRWCNLRPRCRFLHQRGKDVFLCWSYLINVICCCRSMMQACDRRAASVKAWLEEVLCVHLSSLTAVSHIKPMFTTR